MRLEVDLIEGRSAVVSSRSASPLRLLNPCSGGASAWVFQSSLGGGFVGSDDVSLDVDVRAGASLFLSSQASSKVYRASASRYSLRARVEDSASLVVWPDPVVCFEGAGLEQRLSFELASPRASLVCVDSMTAGRSARGEWWKMRRYSFRVSVGVNGEMTFNDAVVLSDSQGGLVRERLDGVGALATVVIAGARLEGAGDALAALVRAAPLSRLPAGPLCTVSPIPFGWVLRLAAASQERLSVLLRGLLSPLTDALLGDDPHARKW